MRGLSVAVLLLVGCAGEVVSVDEEDLIADEEEQALGAGCARPNEVVIWTVRHLNQLLDAIEQHHSPCTTFFVSLPPVLDEAGRKTRPRGGAILQRIFTLRAQGVRIRALAEFHWGGWRSWTQATGNTWYEAGVEFRRRIDEAGYDAGAGDTWAINELPSTVRSDEFDARVHARNAVRGLYDGGAVRRRGAVFVTGVGVNMENYAYYRPHLRDWVCDEPFWTSMDSYVRFFGQEVYADPHRICVGGASIGSRSRHLNDFAMHLARIAGEGPACAAKARSYFNHAYMPTLGAAWQQSEGYGNTHILLTNMLRFLRLEVYAVRAWSSTHQVPDGRIGFAWASHTDAPVDGVVAMADALAGAIARAYGPDGSAARACSRSGSLGGCDCAVSGAFFNEGWSGFATW